MAPTIWLQFSEHSTATLHIHNCVLTTQSWIRLTLHHIIYLALSSTVDSIEPASTLIDILTDQSPALRTVQQFAAPDNWPLIAIVLKVERRPCLVNMTHANALQCSMIKVSDMMIDCIDFVSESIQHPYFFHVSNTSR